MRVFELVANILIDREVNHFFGLMGDGNLRLIPSLTAKGSAYYAARHESAAVSMAAGYARVTGRVGVCTVTQGPGLTNSLSALISARKAHVPLLMLVGDTTTTSRGHPQDILQDRVFTAAGVESTLLRSTRTVGAELMNAFERARSTSHPIGVSMPVDVQEQECDGEITGTEMHLPPPMIKDGLQQVVDQILSARLPLILAGRGALFSSAKRHLETLAEAVGAPLVTSLPVQGLFHGHPQYLGTLGGFSSARTEAVVRESDLVLAFGASLGYFTTKRGTLFEGKTIIQCDVDPTAFGRNQAVTSTILGDAGAVAEALFQQVCRRPSSGRHASTTFPLTLERAEETSFVPANGGEDRIDPRSAMRHIERLIPHPRVLVTDAGHFAAFPCTMLSVQDPCRFFPSLDFGCVGLGLGTAIGASIGDSDVPTILVIGDGGLWMSIGDLDTAVRYDLPLVILVMNDSAYGAEMHFLRHLGVSADEAIFEPRNLAAIAVAMGARGVTVRSLKDFDMLGTMVDDGGGPILVDCKIDPDVRARFLEEGFER